MKRGDFLKTMSALPLGMFAGNKIVEGLSQVDETEAGTVDKNNLSNDSIIRTALVDKFIMHNDSRINGMRLYKTEKPTILCEYQKTSSGSELLKLNGEVVNVPYSKNDTIFEKAFVVKTKKTKDVFDVSEYYELDVLTSIHMDLYNRTKGTNQKIFVMKDILLRITPSSEFSILYRGTFVTLD